MDDLRRVPQKSFDLLYLVSIHDGIETSALAKALGLRSRSSVLRRARQIERQGLLTIEDGDTGRVAHFSLGPETTRNSVQAEWQRRYLVDPVAREMLIQTSQTLELVGQTLIGLSQQIREQLDPERH